MGAAGPARAAGRAARADVLLHGRITPHIEHASRADGPLPICTSAAASSTCPAAQQRGCPAGPSVVRRQAHQPHVGEQAPDGVVVALDTGSGTARRTGARQGSGRHTRDRLQGSADPEGGWQAVVLDDPPPHTADSNSVYGV